MKIYMAGVYHGSGRTRSVALSSAQSIHLRVSNEYRYPWLLESFYYCTTALVEAVRNDKQSLFLDSGAFTAFMEQLKGNKVTIDPKKYADFIKRNRDIIHIASNIDAIGQGREQDTYDMQKKLEGMLGKGVVMPVHHARDDDYWLEKYLGEGYDYIFLGGMVPESTKDLTWWLDHVWGKYLTKSDNTAKIKVHGFGLTTESLMFRYPWESVDSTSWVMSSRFGSLMMDFPDHPEPDGSPKLQKVDFSDRSNKRYELDSWHFGSLKDDEKEFVLKRLEQLEAERVKDPVVEAAFEAELGCKMGYNPEALGKSYGLRDIGNMEYFRRAMNRKVNTFKKAQETLF